VASVELFQAYIKISHLIVVRMFRNLWPTLPDKFPPPPGSGGGIATDSAKALYRQHCLPTEDELRETIDRARAEYIASYPDKILDVLYVMTPAAPEWLNQFAETMRLDGWATVVGSSDLVLDMQQTEAGMAVDMEIARRAELFIGNGVSTIFRHILNRKAHPAFSGRRLLATLSTCGLSITGLLLGVGSGEWKKTFPSLRNAQPTRQFPARCPWRSLTRVTTLDAKS
jgi:hypothetical protein